MRRLFILSSSFILILDRLTKFTIFHKMAHGQSIKIFPNVFHITCVLNTGTAFGLFKGQRMLFISLSMLAIAVIIGYVWLKKNLNAVISLMLGLIAGGAIGNLIDRVSLGYVIDFLDFRIWPVFNIADSAISVGIAILVIKTCTQYYSNSAQ